MVDKTESTAWLNAFNSWWVNAVSSRRRYFPARQAAQYGFQAGYRCGDEVGYQRGLADANAKRAEIEEQYICDCNDEYGVPALVPCPGCQALGEDGRKPIPKYTLEMARGLQRCRICGEPITVPIQLSFGKEYAHERCCGEPEEIDATNLRKET